MSEVLGERYGVRDDEVDIERVRLAMLAEALDPSTFSLLERVGVEHHFLEEFSHCSNPEVPHDKVMQTIELMGAHVIREFA